VFWEETRLKKKKKKKRVESYAKKNFNEDAEPLLAIPGLFLAAGVRVVEDKGAPW
jgi:hypothetical protein